MRVAVAVAVTCLSIGGISVADEALASIKKHTNIPAQELGSALQALARDRNLQFVYVSEEVNSLRTSGAVGELTAGQALTKLLSGTGLTYRFLDDRTITVQPMASAPALGKQGAQSAVPLSGNASPEGENSLTTGTLRVGAEEVGGEDSKGDEKKSFWDRFRLAQVDKGTSSNSSTIARDAPSSDQSSESGTALEEIIVTAQKRTQRLQDVPISIAVVSADEIDRRALMSAGDYLRGIPGVNQMEGRAGQSIIIRGVETDTESQNFFSGANVATYFGETPTTGSGGLTGGTNVDLKLVDIERVEVLRGPQGTAFGSSSMGGAVRTIPVTPKLDQFEGKVAAGYSGTSGTGGDNYNIQAVGNIPLVKDKVALRATAYQYQDSGFYRNVAGSSAAFQARSVTRFGAQAFAIDDEEVGSYYVIGGRIAALFQASDALKFTLSYLRQKTQTDGFPLANSGSYEQTLLQVAPEHVVRGQTGGVFDTGIDIANAVMEYDLGSADLLATYSYVEGETTSAIPFNAFNSFYPASALPTDDHRAHSGEIRLSTRLGGAWNFLVGLYAEEIKDDTRYIYFWYGDPATKSLVNLANNSLGERLLARLEQRQGQKQEAAFGEASWEVLQGLTLTAGVRAYEYDRAYGNDADGAFYGALGTHVQKDSKASGANFRANLSYKLDDDTLLYAGWAQGFRLGRPQVGLAPGICDVDGDGMADGTSTPIASTTEVNSDEVDSYELGGKFTLLERRLTIAADVFRMEWSGMPVTTRVGSQACRLLAYIANAGAALSEGVELQANFQLTEALRVDVGGSWIHARLTEDVPALGASSGNRLPGSPEGNANLGVQYAFKVGGYEAFVRADSIYVGPYDGNLQRSPNTRAGDYVKVDTTARVAIRNLNLDLFVRNLTNQDAFTFRGNANRGDFFGYQLRPRTIGFQLGYTF